MNELSEVVERLTRGMEALELRVSALENPDRAVPPVPVQLPAPATASSGVGAVAVSQESGVFSVLGKAMLGIAGAYVLRALAQSTALPRLPVIAVAIAYAFLWLVPAIRVPAKAWFASAAWAVTSAVILVPMLWELTLRFRILPSAVSAAILGAFVVAASALAWKRHFAEVAWVADGAASIAALVLAIATRELVPFIAALLLMAVVGEIAAGRHRTLRVRPLVAAAADLAVFALIWIYSSPVASRGDYGAVGTAVLLALGPCLLLIYAASAGAQTVLLRRGISLFEIAQVLVAALLSVWTVLVFWPGHGALVLGVLCLLGSAAGYAVAFAWFDRVGARRNYHVYATGSLALLLAGAFLCLPPGWLPLCLGFCAVAAVFLGVRGARVTLQFHAMALLAGSAFAAGLFVYIFRAMAGSSPAAPGWIVGLVGACAILCYAAVARVAEETWAARTLRVFFASLAVGSTVASLVWALLRLTAVGIAPGAEHIAVIRTLAGCGAALALAWSGTRWERAELVWVAWAAVAFVASKLLFEDLRHGHLGFTAASIFLFAVTLLAVPRLVHMGSKATNRGAV